MSGYPNDPPPNYQPSKDQGGQQYPPSQYPQQPYPPQGGYPPQGYPPQGQYPQHGQYPPPQQGQYPPPQQGPYPTQQPGTVVITPPARQVVVVQSPMRYGPNPMSMQCPHCHQQTVTSIAFESGALTWISVGVIVLFGGILGCCLIPFCVNACKDVRHSCSNCHQYIGTYSRLS